MEIFLYAGLILIGLFVVSYFSERFHLPSILAFILIGIILGLYYDLPEELKLGGEAGIIVLFFLLGLKFSVADLLIQFRNIWKAGLIDLLLSFGGTFLLTLTFGFSVPEAFLIGCVLYATSSSISARLLDREPDKHKDVNRFVLSLLIFEDLAAPLLLTSAPFVLGTQEFTFVKVGTIFLGFIFLFSALIFLTVFIRQKSRVVDSLYRHPDAGIGIIGLILTFSGIGIMFGLSEVLGAFIVGILLTEIKETRYLKRLVTPFQDLLLPLFFISFGMSFELTEGLPLDWFFVALVVWGLLSKFLVGFLGGRAFGLSNYHAIESGFCLGPRGEFSILFITLASGAFVTLTGLYIFVSAFLGIMLFRISTGLTDRTHATAQKIKQKIK
ncbi:MULTISPECIES: cation:proton antiporter [Exiguobacterium]|uniref:cation:proton antiporter n=1 Tax=Exiguobacterium TaxID=33986 RepID=UPI001BEBA1D6|nr:MULTISPECIES: cation:proton antiporter [Exiguobacterium]MCT4790831.1 cation:proton antiporter [Exiguobacterium artemiae]